MFTPWSEWDSSRLLEMCVLSGCDYLPSLPGMGVKTAHKTLQKHGDVSRAGTFGLRTARTSHVWPDTCQAVTAVKVMEMEGKDARAAGGYAKYLASLCEALQVTTRLY